MKAFNFRLERVLDYRKYIEKKAESDLAHAKKECRKIDEEIQRLSTKKTDIANECCDAGCRGMPVPMYHIYQLFRQKIDSDWRGAHVGLKEEEKKVAERTIALSKEMIRKKTLETLKDLQYKTYKETLVKEEQKLLDEIVIIRGRRSE